MGTRLALLSSKNFSRSAGRYATKRAPRMTDLGPIFLARQFFSVLTDTPRYCAASPGLNTTGRSAPAEREGFAFHAFTLRRLAGAASSASNKPIWRGSISAFGARFDFRFAGEFVAVRLTI